MLLTVLSILAIGQKSAPPKAPELVGTDWINTKTPITLAERKGKVTMVHYWTFACSNCLNNLPAITRLTAQFKDKGVITIGVHTPEIEIEKKLSKVIEQTAKLKIDYPVLFDGESKNWKRWKQNYWPTLYVIDKKGFVRFQWLGELNYKDQKGEAEAVKAINLLLAE